jgi:broad specificity phosphatase PhoE
MEHQVSAGVTLSAFYLMHRRQQVRRAAAAAPSKKLRVVFIRHGESTNNVMEQTSSELYNANRQPDPDLSPLGVQQATATGEWLANDSAASFIAPFDELFVSPILRTMQTAEPIAKSLNLTPTVWTDVFEHGGIYTGADGSNSGCEGGQKRSEMEARFPGWTIPAAGVVDGLSFGAVDEEGWYLKYYGTQCGTRLTPAVQW